MIVKHDTERNYDLFVFLSTFAKGMAEIYIPIVLYNQGFSLQFIMLYYFIKFIFMAILYYPIIKLGKKYNFKTLLIVSAVTLGISYGGLSLASGSIIGLTLASIFHAIFKICYWGGRHYYAIEMLPKRNIGDEIGNILIASQLALIPCAYIGALILDKFGLGFLTIIITIIALFSIYPLFKTKERFFQRKLNISKTIKQIPKRSLVILALEQFKYIASLLFPLYIYLNVTTSYKYVGILSFILGLASLLFIYGFSRQMDKDKKDYLGLATVLLALTLFIKLNIISASIMVIAIILEGFTSKMHEVSITNNEYALGKRFEAASYVAVFEIVNNLTRATVMLLGVLFINNLSLFLYFCIFTFLIGSIIKFDVGADLIPE